MRLPEELLACKGTGYHDLSYDARSGVFASFLGGLWPGAGEMGGGFCGPDFGAGVTVIFFLEIFTYTP